jgi:hypothetical protein
MSYWSQIVSPSPYRRTPRHLLCQERDKTDKAIKDGLVKKSNKERELSPEEERMIENS